MAHSNRKSDLDREVERASPDRLDRDGVSDKDVADSATDGATTDPTPERVDPRDPNGQNGTPGWLDERQTNPNQEVPRHPEVPGKRKVPEQVEDPVPAEMDPRRRPPPGAVPETRPLGEPEVRRR